MLTFIKGDRCSYEALKKAYIERQRHLKEKMKKKKKKQKMKKMSLYLQTKLENRFFHFSLLNTFIYLFIYLFILSL